MYPDAPSTKIVSTDIEASHPAKTTLKTSRAFTLSAKTSVIDLSKAEITFIAVWGSSRPECTRSSRVSIRDMPILRGIAN